MVFVNEAVDSLLTLGGKVAIGQVGTVPALVATNVEGVDDRKG